MLLPRLPMASSGDEARAAVRVGTCTKAEAADPSGVAATAAACGTMLKKIDHMTTSGETPELREFMCGIWRIDEADWRGASQSPNPHLGR